MPRSSSWQPEWNDFLRQLVEVDGLSFNEIVPVFNEKFGTSFTRNAFIGRAHRLELTCRRAPRNVDSGSRKIKVKRVRTISLAGPRVSVVRVAKAPRPADIALLRNDDRDTIVNPDSRRVVRDPCKWPIEVGECTEPAKIGAYCECHAKLAYRMMPTVKRNATFMKKDEEWRLRL